MTEHNAIHGDILPATQHHPHHPIKVREIPNGISRIPPAIRHHTTRTTQAAARQTLRAIHPMTIGRAGWVAARGALRLATGLTGWLLGADKSELKRVKPDKHHEITRTRQQTTFAFTCIICVGLYFGPVLWSWVAGTVALFACIAAGKRSETILADTPRVFGLNDSMIKDAFIAARLAKEHTDLRLVTPVTGDGKSWTTTVELPPGITVDKTIKRKKELASGLYVSAHKLHITEAGHEGLVTLRATTIDPLTGPPTLNTLVDSMGPVDLWRGLSIATDEHGNSVNLTLPFSGVLIGGLPREGKSVTVNNILIGGLLDPHCELYLVDGKGLDSAPLVPFAKRHAGPGIKEFNDLLKDLIKEMDRRYDRLKELEVDKLTKEICHHEMPLIMFSIDELARYSGSVDKLAKEAMSLLRDIVSVGPACGIIPIFATQKPHSKIVPTDIRDLIPIRIAVRCSTRAQSKTILGDESKVSAAQLPKIKGAAYMVEGDDERLIRPHLVDGDNIRKLTRALREIIKPVPPIVAELIDAMNGEEKVPTRIITQRMGIEATDLADQLRPHRIYPKQLGGDRNARGYKLSDIKAVI